MRSLFELSAGSIATTVEWGHGFVVASAKESILVDVHGRQYIDFSSGWNVVNIGWSRREIKEAIIEQLDRVAFRPAWCVTEVETELARKLVALMPDSLRVCFRATGGAEANEIALMLARCHTGRKKIVSFKGAYHGGTFGALSASRNPAVEDRLGPLVPDFVQVPVPPCFYDPCEDAFNCQARCFEHLQSVLDTGEVAAIITEAVLTNPGVYWPGSSFLPELQRRCERAKALLIIDEVGTGFGRTGKMFAIDHSFVVPDILTAAKALSGGYAPIGVAITTEQIAVSGRGVLDTPTYGWTPLACAASITSIDIIQRERLCQRTAQMGLYLRSRLEASLLHSPIVGAIRGIGLEIAIEIIQPSGGKWLDGAFSIVRICEETGLVIELSSSACAVLLMPPLVIERALIDRGVDILVGAIRSLEQSVAH